MNTDILHERNLIAIPKQEQALAWMINNGPLIDEPDIPSDILRNLVRRHRILRLRRGLYLAPNGEGRLPTFPETINFADPLGYISGHGALSLHRLTDQDIGRWYSVTTLRQSDIKYGPLKAHFVVSPTRRRVATTTTIPSRDDRLVVASVARAFVDEVELAPYGLDFAETARILRFALGTRKLTAGKLIEELGAKRSIAAARRLGFLLEVATGATDQDLLELAMSTSGMTRTEGADVPEYRWRLYLPQTKKRIVGASR